MNAFLPFAAFVLLLTLAAAIRLVMRAPGRGDSLLVALLAATTGVAIVLVLGEALAIPQAVDVGLTFALLAAIVGVAFVVRGWPRGEAEPPGQERAR